MDAKTKAPLAKGGCLGTAEAGGFRRQSLRNFLPIPSSLFTKKTFPFPHGFVLWESASCRIPQSKIRDFCQLPFTREPAGSARGQFRRRVAADNAHGNLLRIVTAPPVPGIVTAVEMDMQTKAPLAKGGFASGKTGGIPRVAGFHMGLCFWKVPAVNPSVKNQRFLPAPFHKGAFGVRHRSLLFVRQLLFVNFGRCWICTLILPPWRG